MVLGPKELATVLREGGPAPLREVSILGLTDMKEIARDPFGLVLEARGDNGRALEVRLILPDPLEPSPESTRAGKAARKLSKVDAASLPEVAVKVPALLGITTTSKSGPLSSICRGTKTASG